MNKTARVRENDVPKRVPLHEQRRDLLTVPPKEGYVRRIVNDSENGQRIERFKLAGWSIVEDPKTQVGAPEVVNRNVSLGSGVSIAVGSGQRAVLMEIPKDLYDKDQDAKEQRLKLQERSMYEQNKKEGLVGRVSKHTTIVDETKDSGISENIEL
jgi:hypothetical protein